MRCEKCGEEFSISEIDNHNLTCSYAFSNKDYEDLIPCEVCNELISFDDYERHLSICSRPRQLPLPIFSFGNFPNLNNIQNNNGNTLENDEELQNNINIINNDPIARSLFSMMVGSLPTNQESNGVEATPAASETEDDTSAAQAWATAVIPESVGVEENYNNDDESSTDQMDIDYNDEDGDEQINESPEDNQGENQEYNFLLNIGAHPTDVDAPPNPPELPVPPYNQNILGLLENILNDLHPQVNPNILGNHNNLDEEEDNYEDLINLEDHVVGISNINDVSELSFEEIECPICSDTKMVKRTTNCGHSFCDGCLQEWLKSSKKCPFCMVELE